jgi:predicted transcriptional regulator
VGSPGPLAEDEQRSSAAAEHLEERPPAPDVDITKPHVARMYDYYLGGKHNYAVDREAAEQMLRLFPQGRIAARMNRRFLIESVRWMAQEAGIRQFLDIGSGLPTQQNVHEVAQAVDPDARVVYVDNDPLVRVHAEALLATEPNTIFLTGNLCEPEDLINRPELREHLDLSRPVGLLLVSVLHCVEDDDQAQRIVKTLSDALPSGSYVAISHALQDESTKEQWAKGREIYQRAQASGRVRTREEITALFTGLTPVGCGVVHISEWTPPEGSPAFEGGGNVVSLDDPDVVKTVPIMCGIARIDR